MFHTVSRDPSPKSDKTISNKQKWNKYTVKDMKYQDLIEDLAFKNKVKGGSTKGPRRPIEKCAFWEQYLPKMQETQMEKEKEFQELLKKKEKELGMYPRPLLKLMKMHFFLFMG